MPTKADGPSHTDDRVNIAILNEKVSSLLEKVTVIGSDLSEVKKTVQNHNDMLNRGKGVYSAFIAFGAVLTWVVGVPVLCLKYLGFRFIG